MSNAALIAIDWGTTSARAYRLDASGQVIDQRSGPYGISQITDGRFDQALQSLLGDWSNDPAPRIACGMIGSRQGWREAPYVLCPASLDSLASGIVEVGGLSIVPGLITRDAQGTPDVLRGEESQLLGAVTSDESEVVAVLPGTHSKWAIIQRGTVANFQTFMTGELFSLLIDHSILGKMAARSQRVPFGMAFDSGVRHGIDALAFTHDLFAARTLALTGELEPSEVEPWLSGVLIGRELRDSLPRIYATSANLPIRVIGEPLLSECYIQALTAFDAAVERGPTDAAAQGLWKIANQAGLLP